MSIADKLITIAENVPKVYAAGKAAGGGGGGSVDGYATVTFMNGDEVLFSRLVLKGDDCPDPYVQNRIELPTKESTVQYTYSFNGWATADGGSADSNALKGITEDKTLYAAFAVSTRTYTVNFYDGDTLLYTEQVPYNGSSDYTYAKADMSFVGWTPKPSNVTSDMDCYGAWEESFAFADASWDYISRMASSGRASEVFAVGDEKVTTVTYADGTTETVVWVVSDFGGVQKDVELDGYTEVSRTPVNLVLTSKHALKDHRKWHSSRGNQYDTFYFYQSSLCEWLNGEFLSALPAEMQSVLQEHVESKNYRMKDDGKYGYALNRMKVSLPKTDSLYGGYSTDLYLGLSYYNDNNKDNRKKTKYGSTTKVEWWLSDATYTNTSNYPVAQYVNTSGSYPMSQATGYQPTTTLGVVPLVTL